MFKVGKTRRRKPLIVGKVKVKAKSVDPRLRDALARPKGAALGALKRDWVDAGNGRFVNVEYHDTQTHGKRGLTKDRVNGPTAVAKHITTADVEFQHMKGFTKSTMVPRAVAVMDMLEAKAKDAINLWQKVRGHTVDGAHKMIFVDRPDYRLELWFEAKEFVFYKLDVTKNVEAWSRVYSNFLEANRKFELGLIYWADSKPLQLPP